MWRERKSVVSRCESSRDLILIKEKVVLNLRWDEQDIDELVSKDYRIERI